MRPISLFGIALLVAGGVALAAPSPVVERSVAVCDPNAPARCVAPDSTGALLSRGTNVTLTQTIVVLTAATSAPLVAANPARKFLAWQVVGANPVTVVPGEGPAVAGDGFSFSTGGGTTFQNNAIPTGAFSAISTAGSTVIVWQGL